MIWVSKQRDLNDPFEYYFHVEPDMTFEQVARRKKDATDKNYLEKQEELIGGIKERFSTGGIFSLSERRDISLMWSHYADYHKGICIGYHVDRNNDLGNGKCRRVRYRKNPPSFSLCELWAGVEKTDDNFAKKLFEIMVLSKDRNWRYEHEWRVVYDQSDQLIIPNFQVSSVIFGMRMPELHRKRILDLLDNKTIVFFEAVKQNDSYNVRVARINT